MTKLRAQMMQDLELGGYAEKTRGHYLRSIAQFAKFHGRSPDVLHQPEVREWVRHHAKNRSATRAAARSMPR